MIRNTSLHLKSNSEFKFEIKIIHNGEEIIYTDIWSVNSINNLQKLVDSAVNLINPDKYNLEKITYKIRNLF